MNEEVVLDLCAEILRTVKRLGFKDSSIAKIEHADAMRSAENRPPELQKTILTMMFYNLLMYTGNRIPQNIRLALNISPTPLGWLHDMTSTVLPFMLANEDVFFPE